jgi:hypothetical protein
MNDGKGLKDYVNDLQEFENAQVKKEYIYFNKDGKEIDNDVDKVYAQVVIQNKKEYYQVVTYQNALLDPMGKYQKRQAYLETKMKKVDKQTFNFYLTYLQTNNSIYLTRANRSYQNG